MRILLALGGNALLRNGVDAIAASIASVSREHEVVITHGYGPHVGHALELRLRNALPERDVVSVLTQVVVADEGQPSANGNGRVRPVRPSEPQAIAEIRSLRRLVDSGALVICAGGGGIPVALDGLGTMHRVETVVDEDLIAALLARRLDADLLLMLTDVDAVRAHWGEPNERPIAQIEPGDLREMSIARSTMGSKVEAACRFAEATGRRAAIGALTDAARIARAEAGTQVVTPAAEPAIAAARRSPKR